MPGDNVEDRGAGRACRFPVVAEALRARIRVEDERRTVVPGLRVLGPTVGDDLAGLGLVGGGGERRARKRDFLISISASTLVGIVRYDMLVTVVESVLR